MFWLKKLEKVPKWLLYAGIFKPIPKSGITCVTVTQHPQRDLEVHARRARDPEFAEEGLQQPGPPGVRGSLEE